MPHRPPVPLLYWFALRAASDLFFARLRLATIKPKHVIAGNARTAARTRGTSGNVRACQLAEACDEVAFFIPRVAAMVPWRSDCLVQALAGQVWLARRGVSSEIKVGTNMHKDGRLDAHAWLSCGGRVVLGGDISGYDALIDADTTLGRMRPGLYTGDGPACGKTTPANPGGE